MEEPVTSLSTEAANFNWLLDNFVRTVPGTSHTLVVSADGLLMAMSSELDRTSGDQMAAIVAGIDRKSTRLNSSHVAISYGVFCLIEQKHYQRSAAVNSSSAIRPSSRPPHPASGHLHSFPTRRSSDLTSIGC